MLELQPSERGYTIEKFLHYFFLILGYAGVALCLWVIVIFASAVGEPTPIPDDRSQESYTQYLHLTK